MSWHVRWKSLIGNQYICEEIQIHGCVIVVAYLFEDRTLVYAWQASPGEKAEGVFHYKQKKVNKTKRKVGSGK